ncbi:MAG: phosphate acetyltransferase [Planctomycetota bacterium]|mgnify:CR=1 FL=1
MARALLVVPSCHNVGLTSVCLGLVRAIERQGIRAGFFKPIAQSGGGHETNDRSVAIIRSVSRITTPDALERHHAEALLGRGEEQVLLEEIAGRYQKAAKDTDLVVIEGMVPGMDQVYSSRINSAVSKCLDADVILVGLLDPHNPAETAETIEIQARNYPGRIIGAILSKIEVPGAIWRGVTPGAEPPLTSSHASLLAPFISALTAKHIPVVGAVPLRPDLAYLRLKDLARTIGARTLIAGDANRRVERTTLIARNVQHSIDFLRSGSLVVTPGDRDDIFMACALSALSGVQLAGVLLTGDFKPDSRVMRLCEGAMSTGLSVLVTEKDSFMTVAEIVSMNSEMPIDDSERIERTMDVVANNIDKGWVGSLPTVKREQRMSPPAFRYQLIEHAHALNKRIVLPEGDEPRTVAAAAICAERGIARCILLGDPARIRAVADGQGIKLPESVQIMDATSNIERMIAPMVELRKTKGLTAEQAREQLQDNVVLGTMMIKTGEVDGLVSGAVHTTANTIRPALQLIKLQPGMKLASSIFFMCLPDQVVVYGDCAVNPNPTAEEMADIAIQSADSAAAFGIPPRVAMLSYSTGTSGAGSDVEKVDQATKLAKQRRPDLLIDGPLQYDAAIMPDVAKSKAPNSPVAGRATVFIFPDLNAGNTAYKAVQRSTGCISIGPMMQGMARPVNDLSRGCLVEDIVFTIALTAIQAGPKAQQKAK